MQNILIAYFSRADENYMKDGIRNIEKGNTEVLAEYIKEITNGTLFKIETEKNYPYNYYECTDVATTEKETGEIPKLKNYIENKKYNIIYLGYPIWWGTIPQAVAGFLENIDTENTQIYPFCTHEGSKLGTSIEDIKKLCPKANLETPFECTGSSVYEKKNEIINWINNN